MPDLVLPDLFVRLSLALAIGFLVGVERGWKDRAEVEGGRTAGLRTFSLVGLSGGLAGALHSVGLGPAAILVLGGGAIGAVLLFKWRESAADGSHSVTTPVAAVVVFGLGVLAVLGDMRAAAAAGVATAALLALKPVLHGWLRRLTWTELRASLVLLAMTVIVLPILPDRTLDPWNALNPHDVWAMTVLIAALSFAGYIAVKLAGESRGILFAGAAGGLVSSTVVTLDNGRRAAEAPALAALLASGTAAAGAVSVFKVLSIALLLAPGLAPMLGPALGGAGAAFLAGAAVLYRRSAAPAPAQADRNGFANPFEPLAAFRFGLLLAGVLAVSKILADNAGPAGYLAFAALSGFADIDAVVLSAGRMAGTSLTMDTAAAAILCAVGANIVMKTVYAFWIGGRGYGRLILAVSLAAAGLGAVLFRVFAPVL
ncbi:MgtC/SapB family protein [Prosthecomicrobium sp. N25]|uniref:MgtC/SapB family protein n=1 Tax=Prosthecomicrobium sp. N25 TaxID=3129254 RepID=UPI003077B61D